MIIITKTFFVLILLHNNIAIAQNKVQILDFSKQHNSLTPPNKTYSPLNPANNQQRKFEVNGFEFIITPIRYIEESKALVAPSLKIYFNKNQIFELTNNPDKISFTQMKFGTSASDSATSAEDLLGNNSKILIVSTFSGGKNCCNSYYFLDLSIPGDIKLLQRIDTFSSKLKFIAPKDTDSPSTAAYTLEYNDNSYANFYANRDTAAYPRILLTYNAKTSTFDLDTKSMVKNLSDKELNIIFENTGNQVLKLLQDYGDIEVVIIPIIKASLDLIYSGNADKAFTLIDKTWPNNFQTIKKADLVYELKCRVRRNNYWTQLNQINPGLTPPTDCPTSYK